MNKNKLLGISVLLITGLTGCVSKNQNNETENVINKETEKDSDINLSSNLEKARSEYIENEKPVYIDGILLVNKEFGIPKNFASNPNLEAMEAYRIMKEDALKDGITINIRSGFRSNETQAMLFNNYSKRDGEQAANRYSARPGHSEHETGLAFDFTTENTTRSIGDWFTDTPQAKWLYENAHNYGFILRYPNGKEHITGYKYESWHYRFLGVEHSKNFNMNNLTLEEYLKVVNN